jgi:hypothetical protein
LVLAVGLLAWRSVAGILEKVGHPAAALDDAYIHFQYARAIAEGHPFRFQAGAPPTSGCTSLLWPALLAPFWALGARSQSILWPAWGLSFLALGGLAWEARHLTERLAGRTAGIGAGAMTLAFGGYVWCAASGMEVVPFAWAIARASRRAAEWAELQARGPAVPPEPSTGRRAIELVALAWTCALFRPEGALTALFIATALGVFPAGKGIGKRGHAIAAASAVIAGPLLLWALTGSPRSTTAVAKLLPGNPYYPGAALIEAVREHAKLLVGTLLNGEVWSAEFLPSKGAAVALAGLAAIAVLGARTGAWWRAAAALLLAVTMFAPCFYVTFLWNRLRYLWPFATGWIVGLACLGRLVGDGAALIRPRYRLVTGIVCGAFAGMFAAKIEWVMDDVAQSASGIDRQQVALGRWAKESLPLGATIGVNDTGAIAYFGDRRTFDIVGLTTLDEARYWVAGVGSRWEHYERLFAAAPQRLPTHFIVYPEWMALDSVLGRPLHEATVTDSSILGGRTMRAYEADWTKLGTGERPWTPMSEILDVLDVADLESEAEHHYELYGAREGEQVVREGETPLGTIVVDGGRTRRSRERFIAKLRANASARGVVRVEAAAAARVTVFANGENVGEFVVGETDTRWVEGAFEIPANAAGPATRVELRFSGGVVSVFHYWFDTSP